MSRNILLSLRFDGTAYHGWQLQENAVTVQQRVNEAVNSVLHEGINVNGCSRTDAGVHANCFCCNFRTEKSIPCEKLPDAVNYYLPKDIAAFAAREVPADFHARFSCVGKEYIYKILQTPGRDPFYENRALFYPFELNDRLLDDCAKSFLGEHDFSAFCSSGSAVRDKVRRIDRASVERNENLVTVTVRGNGFLYNMVRIIVGTLLYVNEGKLPRDCIPDVIDSRDRLRAGKTAPAHGLYLNRVFYNEEEMK